MRRLQDFIGQSLVAVAVWASLITAATAADDPTPEPAKPGKRLVFFAPAGPVLIEAVIDTGSKSVEQIRQEYATDLFARLDVDKSGKLESTEQANIPFLQRGGGQPVSPEVFQTFLVDGSLTPDGLAQYVNAQLGPTFMVIPKPPRLDQTVRLADVLDRDGDSIVSLEEVVRSETALRRFDLDDDESLSVQELQPFPASILQAQRQEIAATRDAPVVELATDDSRSKAVDRILSKFANGGDVLPLAVCGLGQTSPSYDADSDGNLSRDELSKWLAGASSDVKLTARIRESALTRVAAELPESPRVKPPSDTNPRRWQVSIDGMDLQADAQNNRNLAGFSLSLAKTRFLQADTDDNDYLNESEYSSLQFSAPFSAVDVNTDGMLRMEEVEVYAKTIAQLSQTRLVLTVTDDVTSLYQLMDTNRDRRLSPRELDTLEERLKPHDRNGNGRFDSSDFVSKYRLSFAFSVPEGFNQITSVTDQMMNTRAGRPRAPRVGPLWFQKMDRNRDTDISWREFLGPKATFEKIDANHDGLIDKDEAEAASTGAGGEVVGER
jgi:Ca2+-binding EF-hand superfamily protein